MVEVHDLRNLAAAVAARADLRDIRLFNVKADLANLPERGGLSYVFDARIEVQYVAETSALIVDGSYDLAVTYAELEAQETEDDQEAKGEPLATLTFQFAALYSVHHDDGEAPQAFPDEELDAFGKTTGMLALHPYAREFVSNMTGRMGLPPLHIGTAHVPLDKRNGD